MTKSERKAYASTLAKRFKERAEALGYKGKKRDDAALDYWVGAATWAEVSGDAETASYLGMLAAMWISVRGWFAINEIASWNDEAPPA